MNKTKPRILSGFMELLPAEQIEFNKMLMVIRNTFEEFGFTPQETPLLEPAEILLSKSGGETEKQIYAFEKGDEKLALRFDLTVPLARFVAMNYAELTFPFRRYQIGKVYRGERAQRGRFREFYQCDIDVVGDGGLSLTADAEIPSVIANLFRRLNLGGFTIRINNRKILSGLVESLSLKDKRSEVLRAIDKLEKIGRDGVFEELKSFGIEALAAEKILEFVEIEGTNDEKMTKLENLGIDNEEFRRGVADLWEVIRKAYLFGVREGELVVDLTIARGLDYYTGTVYETKMDDVRIQGSVCSGGRYDNLAETFCERRLPGVGISLGLTRLFSQLLDAGIVKGGTKTPADVLVIPMGEEQTDYALGVAAEMRGAGIRVEVYTEEVKLGKKFVYADRLGVKWAVVLGGDEESANLVTLKNMSSGEQEKDTLAAIVNKLKEVV